MTKRFIITFLCVLIFTLAISPPARAISLLSIVNIVKAVTGSIRAATSISTVLDGYVPHKFPFGGHITSSERACSLKGWIWIPTPFGPVPCVNCLYWPFAPFGGRAIKVGPPVASPGKVIVFPWISDVYRNKQENKIGPWALGLGFTPFPLKQINDALGLITIPYGAGWIDHLHIACQASGEKDLNGNEIYKVILKLGTSY